MHDGRDPAERSAPQDGARPRSCGALSTDYLAAWGICKSAKSRGLADLEAEGLVAVERRAGHTARVKLLV